MATKQERTTEVAEVEKKSTAVATSGMDDAMFAADAGAGMEGATAESFAIPFLSVLQKGSPTVDEALPTHNPKHKAGMFHENVNERTFDGKAGVLLIPCAYRRVFLRWAPRDGGGGFKGEIAPDVVADMRAKGQIVELDGKLYIPQPDGTVSDKRCDRVADVRNHYVLIVDEATGGWTEALLSLGSTQIKKSKALMSALASVKVSGPNGMFTPPTFANQIRATSIGESNDKGTWFGVRFELAGKVQRGELYAAAKAFHGSVVKGGVVAKYDDSGADEPSGATGF